jgi:mono/diheme cytochrome c family protein
MRQIFLPCVIATLTLATPFPVLAQPIESGSPSSGRQIAITICGNCHKVAPTMPSSPVASPSFEDIANLPSTTALSLYAFLRSNHNKMPNFILSPADTDDVIAYIISLKRK